MRSGGSWSSWGGWLTESGAESLIRATERTGRVSYRSEAVDVPDVQHDVRVVGVARGRVVDIQDRWRVPFDLSSTPDSDWSALFQVCYDRVESATNRRAYVSGDLVILEAPPAEVAAHDLRRILRAVEETNEEYRAAIERSEDVARKQREQAAQDADALARTLDEIDRAIAEAAEANTS